MEGNPKNCQHYLSKKKRYCRMLPGKNEVYCGEHLQNEELRIQCPVDPTHTCFKSRLKSHLKKCNAVKNIPTEEWYKKDVNSYLPTQEENEKCSIKDLSEDEITRVINIVKSVTCPNFETDYEFHPQLLAKISEMQGNDSALKHLKQQASLANILGKQIPSAKDLCVVEFGAGRGGMTDSIIDAFGKNTKNLKYILIDRSSSRRKLDAKHRKKGELDVRRIRVDIRHLDLGKVDNFSHGQLVSVSKHLCGPATDLALICLKRTVDINCIGCGVIALCCHHRCTWNDYCGKEYMSKIGLTEDDFKVLVKLTSWAVCKFKSNDEDTHLSNNEKEEIGIKCKRLIDLGRLQFLKNYGLEAQLIEYTSKTISLENICLVFKYKPTK